MSFWPWTLRRARCSICKSPHQAELERGYFTGAAIRELAREFGFSERGVRRHVAWFYLDVQRKAWRVMRGDPAWEPGIQVSVDQLLRVIEALTWMTRGARSSR